MSDLVNRLRGIYTIPITAGCGPIDGKMALTRTFDNLPPIVGEAAAEIERLRLALGQIAAFATGKPSATRMKRIADAAKDGL